MFGDLLSSKNLVPAGTEVRDNCLYLLYDELFALGAGPARRCLLAAVAICRQTNITHVSVLHPVLGKNSLEASSLRNPPSPLEDSLRQAFALLGEKPPKLEPDTAKARWTFSIQLEQSRLEDAS